MSTTATDLLAITEPQALELTARIRTATDHLWMLVLEAYERKAWAALGYRSWRDYVMTEFGWSQSTSYRVLNQAYLLALEGDGSRAREIDQREADKLKKHLPEMRDRVAAGEDATEVLDDVRARVVELERIERQERERKVEQFRTARELIRDELQPRSAIRADEELDGIRVTQALYAALDTLAAMPAAAEVMRLIPEYERCELEHLPEALAWLNGFAAAWRP
jgi:hypothetical protein